MGVKRIARARRTVSAGLPDRKAHASDVSSRAPARARGDVEWPDETQALPAVGPEPHVPGASAVNSLLASTTASGNTLSGETSEPTLWVVGTPIGNLADMTARARTVLATVHAIAAEDTRQLRKLLTCCNVVRPPRVVSYREENRLRAADAILAMLGNGHDVAIVTDAGMPAISDPGEYLVDRCHEAGFRVSPVPGPSAVVTALACSGLPSSRWSFEGFLSRRNSHRAQHLRELAHESRTMILLEAPSRIQETLAELRDVFGADRRCCLARELTKVYEEVRRFTLGEAVEWSHSRPMRGEFTIVVEGVTHAPAPVDTPPSDEELRTQVEAAMATGLTRRQAAKTVAGRYNLDARDVYRV